MLSIPPAMPMLNLFSLRASAMRLIDFIPDAQTLFTFQQTVSFFNPLNKATYLAGFYPKPAPRTTPIETSFISSLSIPTDSIKFFKTIDPNYTAEY